MRRQRRVHAESGFAQERIRVGPQPLALGGFMQAIIRAALQNRLLVVVVALATVIGGYAAYRSLPVDAYPDISPSLVQVFVETEGLAPEEVEMYVTYPLESAMNGLPKLDHVRSVSNFRSEERRVGKGGRIGRTQ